LGVPIFYSSRSSLLLKELPNVLIWYLFLANSEDGDNVIEQPTKNNTNDKNINFKMAPTYLLKLTPQAAENTNALA
jgi:hypothetical protein